MLRFTRKSVPLVRVLPTRLSVIGASIFSVAEAEFWTTARLLAKIKLPVRAPVPLPITIFPAAPESTVMAAGLLPSPMVMFLAALLFGTLKRTSKAVVTKLLNVSDLICLSTNILVIVLPEAASLKIKSSAVLATTGPTLPTQLALVDQ